MRFVWAVFCCAAFALLPAHADPLPPDCAMDRDVLLNLDFMAFDQDLKGGWRPYGASCKLKAANLIRDYRANYQKIRPNDPRISMLFWHEGQMRALIGETDQAIELFLKSKRTPDWDAYVDATVAFLRNDRPTLETAREFVGGRKRIILASEPQRGRRLSEVLWSDLRAGLRQHAMHETCEPELAVFPAERHAHPESAIQRLQGLFMKEPQP